LGRPASCAIGKEETVKVNVKVLLGMGISILATVARVSAQIPGGVATMSNVDLGNGSSIALKRVYDDGRGVRFAASGHYQSPACDWAASAKLDSLTVAADLNGGRVRATVETSRDGFQTIQSRSRIRVRDGVNSYPLRALSGASRAVRVRFDLSPARNAPATPVIDAFQITGKPAESARRN
jgi:hypothetical protein